MSENYEKILDEIRSEDVDALGTDGSVIGERHDGYYLKGGAEEKRLQQKARVEDIRRAALNQTVIDLSAVIPDSDIQAAIVGMTSIRRELMAKHTATINNIATRALKSGIPAGLLRAYKKFPKSVQRSPGFYYTTGADYGGVKFWITPDIPYYYEQGTEEALLKEAIAAFDSKFTSGFSYRESLEKAAYKYSLHSAKLRDKEIEMASYITTHGITTYFDLLKRKPLWFEQILIKTLKEQQNEDMQCNDKTE
jgi:hypothetical protein